MTPDYFREMVARTRAAQGLPPTIQDPAALRAMANIYRLVDIEPLAVELRSAA